MALLVIIGILVLIILGFLLALLDMMRKVACVLMVIAILAC